MREAIRRLALGFILLSLAAAVLLYTDRGSRAGSRKAATATTAIPIRVALVQHASLEVLEQGTQGMIEALAERGYTDGQRIRLRRYNAEADIGTANAIAKEVASGSFDLILTISTVSLQTVANANKTGPRTPHVFGLVSDPYSAGVDINPTNHLIHPPHLAGCGSMQPIEEIFRTARQFNPALRSIGLVWNAAEANSLAQTKLARRVCADLGINLLEANADNSSAVLEAANAIIARGAEAMFISGDVTVNLAIEQVIAACRRARIPAFSALPTTIRKGTLFDMGANYVQIGRQAGTIAADVLDGKSPADIPIDNFVPLIFLYNQQALTGLRDAWVIPEALRKTAAGFITATTTNLAMSTASATPAPKADAKPATAPAPGRTYRIGLAYFAPEAGADLCMKGILDGLRELGYAEGQNLEVRRSHAQAEIANIPAVLQNLDSSDVDIIVPLSTPLISGACSLVKRKPVVFTYCSDPVAAGAGTSFTNHLPHITGIGSFPPVEDMAAAIRATLPAARSVGTVYNASEANSVKVVSVARGILAAAGLKLEEVTVSTSADVLQACQALAGRHIDALYIQGDNTVIQGFDAVVKACRDTRIPLFVDDPESARRGALACVGLGYYKPGFEAALPIARVLNGEKPANIPMRNVSEKTVWLNPAEADRLRIKFPASLLRDATPPAPATPAKPKEGANATPFPAGRTYQVDLVEYAESPTVEANREGIRAGLKQAGLVEGQNLQFRIRNAQGDMATLNTIVDASGADRPDLLMVASTPALQAALRRADSRNVVFSLVANPLIAGAGRTDADHLPRVTGAYLPAPHAEGLAALRQCMPNVRRIGSLFVPSEINSVFYKDDLLRAAKAAGIDVEIIGVNSPSEIADAAIALCGRRIDAVCQISDNLTGASFASIAQAAKRAHLPLMGFAFGQSDNGAFMTVSRDFFDGGVASAAIATRVLRGESPAQIPFELVQKIRYRFNTNSAAGAGITIPPTLLQRAEARP